MTRVTHTTHPAPARPATSRVLHGAARYYDLLAWLLTLGREGALRERLVDIARLAPGESVLDVGCGTGTLALAARRRLDAAGGAGIVRGVDASPEMVAQATRKAERAGLEVSFQVAGAEALPFPDASVDVVLSTLVLHHLPAPVRAGFVREVRRILRPGGRVLAVDFEPPEREPRGLVSRVHRHGHVSLQQIVDLLGGAGLRVTETGSVGVSDLRFAIATTPAPAEAGDDAPPSAPEHRSLPSLPLPRWVLPAAVVALVAAHALVFRVAWSRLALAAAAAAALLAIVAITHLGIAGGLHASRRGRRHRYGRGG